MITLHNGRKIRVLTIIDLFTRECLALEVDTSINGLRVTNTLHRIAYTRGLPESITIDTEFAGKALDAWAFTRGVNLDFIRPGKPIDNAFIESFNAKFREQCLNDNWFMSLSHPGFVYSIDSHKNVHGIVYQTARVDLLGLVKLRLFEEIKRGRKFYFKASDNLPEKLKKLSK